jgi:hypothetical protein
MVKVIKMFKRIVSIYNQIVWGKLARDFNKGICVRREMR